MRDRWRYVFALIAIEAVVILICALIGASSAPARDLGQWETADPAVRAWYNLLRQPDNPAISCCGEADAYWADGMVTEDGKLFAIITDERADEPLGRPHIAVGTRIEIPPHKIKRDGGNPTGHFVVFIGASGNVYCYVTGTLS